MARDHGDAHIGDDPLHAQLRVLLNDLAAGKPAGVVGFVLQPQLHPPFGRFLDRNLHQAHVLRRKVLRVGVRAAYRRHVDDEYAVGREPV